MKLIRALVLAGMAGAVALGPLGCSSGSSQQDVDNPPALTLEEADFLYWYREMIATADQNPGYRRIPINSPSQQQRFNQIIEDAYFGRISADDFVATATSWYPDYETSIRIIAGYLPTPEQRQQIEQNEKAVEEQG